MKRKDIRRSNVLLDTIADNMSFKQHLHFNLSEFAYISNDLKKSSTAKVYVKDLRDFIDAQNLKLTLELREMGVDDHEE